MKPFLPIPYLLRKSLVKDLAGSGLSGRNHRWIYMIQSKPTGYDPLHDFWRFQQHSLKYSARIHLVCAPHCIHVCSCSSKKQPHTEENGSSKQFTMNITHKRADWPRKSTTAYLIGNSMKITIDNLFGLMLVVYNTHPCLLVPILYINLFNTWHVPWCFVARVC